jgi:hypothetical protein
MDLNLLKKGYGMQGTFSKPHLMIQQSKVYDSNTIKAASTFIRFGRTDPKFAFLYREIGLPVCY